MKDHELYYDSSTGWAVNYGKLTTQAHLMRQTVDESVKRAMEEDYPIGSSVIVGHHRGFYRATVSAHCPKTDEIIVKNDKSGKEKKVHFGNVNVPEY